MANKFYSTPVVTPLHRARFVHLFKPEEVTSDDGTKREEYNVLMLDCSLANTGKIFSRF